MVCKLAGNCKYLAKAMQTSSRLFVLGKKASPTIFLGLGIIGVVGSAIGACAATLKVESVMDEAKEKIDKIHYAKENFPEEKYSEEDMKKDLMITYVQTGVAFAKLYWGPVTIGTLSIISIVGSNRILQNRNVALAAAYKAVSEGFAQYRSRVVKDVGVEKDREYRYGYKEEKYIDQETDADGNITNIERTKKVYDPNNVSIYARFYDETSTAWSKTPEYNLVFLKNNQAMANDLLHARGHLFLNEVYDMLGLPRSQAGQVVGWVISKDGDNYVDFGLANLDNERMRAFVNGYEHTVLLDFNVDGVVYDLI